MKYFKLVCEDGKLIFSASGINGAEILGMIEVWKYDYINDYIKEVKKDDN